jgi:hypothetical protein
MTRPIAYLTGFYPRATDTFIQREVGSLRAQGFEVLTNTVRATDRSHHVGAEQRAEFAATFQVLNTAKNPVKLIGAHLSVLRHNPRGWCEALALDADLGDEQDPFQPVDPWAGYFLSANTLAY